MIDKIINGLMILLVGFIVYLNHIDRDRFLDELNKTTISYVETLKDMSTDIKTIKSDVVIVKELVEKSVNNKKQEDKN